MSHDLAELNISELEALIAEARQLITEKQQQRIQSAYLDVVRIASDLGMTVEELIARGRSKNQKTISRGVVPPRYRNPLNETDTWTGRGKQPRWVAHNISRGITLEDMLIRA